MPQLSPAERDLLERLLLVLEEFRKLDPDMQLPMAEALLLVALNPGISRTEVMHRLGVAGSTATRNLMGLMPQGRLGRPGHGLIEQQVNPEERRWRMHSLSPEGWLFIRLLLNHFRGQAQDAGSDGKAGDRVEDSIEDPIEGPEARRPRSEGDEQAHGASGGADE